MDPSLHTLASDWPVPHSRSAELFEQAKELFPGGVVGQSRLDDPHPIYMRRAEGSHIEDVDGNSYVDFHCGFGAVLLGHSDPRLRRAANDTLSDAGVTFATAHPLELELAERLITHVPSAERVEYACIGTEATYHAVRAARVATGRRKVVKFEGNYHGWHDYLYWSVRFAPDQGGTLQHPTPVAQSGGMGDEAARDILISSYNDLDRLGHLFAQHGRDIAAVIVEPIFHNGGAVMPEPGFLELCRSLCSEHGSLLVFDEVITGFRQGLGGAQALFGVMPDLTTLGKAIANGYPISVLAGRKEYMEALAPLGAAYFSGTFNGHLLNVAMANECCKILEADPPYERLGELGSELRRGIEAAGRSVGVPISVGQFGSVWSVHFSDEEPRSLRDILQVSGGAYSVAQAAYRHFLVSRGMYVHPHTVIRGYLTDAHTAEDVKGLVETTAEFLETYRGQLEQLRR